MKFSTAISAIAIAATVLAAPAAAPEAQAEGLFIIPWALNLIGNLGHSLAYTLGGGWAGPGPAGPYPPAGP